MIRTQIQLTEAQAKALRELSRRENISIAKLIRRSLDQFLNSSMVIDAEERRIRAIKAVGRFRSGKSDISLHHDRYLDDSYQS
jgi:hypothetical protein